jgi:glucose/arabinose dehydrogenase
MRRLLVLVVAVVSLPGVSLAARAVAPGCEVGRYVLPEGLPGGSPAPAILEVGDGQAAILDRCAPTRLRTARRRSGVRISARWPACAGGGGRLRLKARLDAACRVLTGTVKRGGTKRSFATEKSIRVLVFTKTAGFRHASIDDVHRVLGGLDPTAGLDVTITEDAGTFSDEGLAHYDVVLFGNTTGDVLDDPQQEALQRFVRGGKGWVGAHSAADTEHGWSWYGRLVGAYFISHPLLPVDVTVTTEDATHPSTAHLPPAFQFTDEIYNFDRNPRADHAVLLTVDEAGFIYPNFPPTPSMGEDHPIAWYKEFEGGRSFYTNLGHRPQTWDDPAFLAHLLAGIRWAAEPPAWSRVVLTAQPRNPMTLAVTPAGDVYWAERTGEVMRWEATRGLVTEAARLDVDTSSENGLLGLVLDPAFADTRWIYLYHAEPAAVPPAENVLSRFEVAKDGRVDLGSRVDLLRVPSDRACCHEGGSLAFHPDGTLLVSAGDNTNPFGEANGFAPLDERPGRERFNAQRTAQNPFDLRGKILRINADGTIPAGNLFPASGAQGRPEIFVMGCRNPFRIAVDAQTGRLFWGDVGPDAIADGPRGPRGYDEINLADRPGNYGWPWCIADNRAYGDFDFATGSVMGAFDCDGMVPALLAYDYVTRSEPALGTALDGHVAAFTGRTAIAGTFYRRPAGEAPFALPAPYADTLLMTEWTRDIVAAVDVSAAGELRSVRRLIPWERFRRPIDLEVGPDGALYVLEFGTEFFGNNPDAQLTRIEHSAAGELLPVAVIDAAPLGGDPPLTVEVSGVRSQAPGRGDAVVKYRWDFDGDGRPDARKPTARHTFKRPGLYTITLTVVGRSKRRSVPAAVQVVVGNTAPEVTIESPTDGTVIARGAPLTLRGGAVDAQDGVAPCDDLVWDLRLGHNAHSHPWRIRRGCVVELNADVPADHASGAGLFLAVELSHTDTGGPRGEPPLTGRASIRLELP